MCNIKLGRHWYDGVGSFVYSRHPIKVIWWLLQLGSRGGSEKICNPKRLLFGPLLGMTLVWDWLAVQPASNLAVLIWKEHHSFTLLKVIFKPHSSWKYIWSTMAHRPYSSITFVLTHSNHKSRPPAHWYIGFILCTSILDSTFSLLVPFAQVTRIYYPCIYALVYWYGFLSCPLIFLFALFQSLSSLILSYVNWCCTIDFGQYSWCSLLEVVFVCYQL